MSLARKLKREQERKKRKTDMKVFYEHADRIVEKWDAEQRAMSEERALASFSFVLSMCCKVLCRDFGYGAIPKNGKPPKNSKLVRFSLAVQDEIRNFDSDKVDAMQKYCQEVYEEYGVKFEYD